MIDSLRLGLLALACTTYAVQLARRRLRVDRWPRLLFLSTLTLWAVCDAMSARWNANDVRWTWFTLVGFTLLFVSLGLKAYLWNQRRHTGSPLR
jgi:hypothetical protein